MKRILNMGPALIITAATLWALDGIIRRSLYILPPLIIVFYEHLIGAIIILPFIAKSLLKQKISKKELALIAFIALFSSLLGTLWFTQALLSVGFISFSVVYLIQKLQPIFAISAAAIFLKERIDRRYIKWALLALVSAYFVTFKNGVVNLETGSGTIIAALYALGAAFAWGSSTAFSKMALLKKPDSYVTGLRFIFTAIFAIIAIIFFRISLPSLNPSQMSSFIFIALSTGMVSVLIYYKGLKKTEAKISTMLELVYPLLAVIIDAVFYKSYLFWTQYLAAAVLLFSIYNISRLQKK